MPKDEILIARKKHPRISNLFRSDGRNGAACFLFGIAAQKDFGGRFYSAEK
jgi:hypothetical protein